MGFEFRALIPEQKSSDEVRERIVDGVASMGWKIIRVEDGCFTVAFRDRADTSWDEDFMVCVDSHIYVLSYMSSSVSSVLECIERAIAPDCSHLNWDEL